MYIALYSYIVYSSKLLDSYDIVNIKNTIELIHNFLELTIKPQERGHGRWSQTSA